VTNHLNVVMRRTDPRASGRNRGFTLLAAAVSAIALFGTAGLAIDVGRLYITKSEAQSYADSAAVAAAIELDGNPTAITRAEGAGAANTNKFNFWI
jgi:uncharacterized membrane protein